MDEYLQGISVESLSEDPRVATKILLDRLLKEIHPLADRVRISLQSGTDIEKDTSKISDVYTLCLSQINKCALNLFEVFRIEFHSHLHLQETRQCNLERLSWCLNRLNSIDKYLENVAENNGSNSSNNSNNSFNVTVMYFVNWIDLALELLSKLSDDIYKTDYKDDEELHKQWKTDIVECICELHGSIDELLLSAMMLCKYCLPNDQPGVKAWCQAVLRETKTLLSSLIEGDISTSVIATIEALKLPTMPFNIQILIDVLKDMIYALETNTNSALLSLLVHCFSQSPSPVDLIQGHFMENEKGCSCIVKRDSDTTENCAFVKEFDFYNERLLQIGSFAVSCSSDQSRILCLRSNLASLEALDPYLVPALMTSAAGHHSNLLIKSWRQEVRDIRDIVYLIVDPTAFSDKSTQMMERQLREVLKEVTYNNGNVCAVINIGCVVHNFFAVYNEQEPDALPQREKLMPLLADLNKVQLECKVVSNLLCTPTDYKYDVKTPQREVTLDQLYKRLKLLFSVLNRIKTLLQPKDNDQLSDEEEAEIKNVTHTIIKTDETYINSQKKPNLTRSIFARSLRSSTRSFPLSKPSKHPHNKNCSKLNFSKELDRLFLSDSVGVQDKGAVKNRSFERVRESSVLYNFSPIKYRSSMRKIVLNRHLTTLDNSSRAADCQSKELLDENDTSQLTEVLNQINDMTSIIVPPSTKKSQRAFNKTQKQQEKSNNAVRINVNNQNSHISQNIWRIPITNSSVKGESAAAGTNETIMSSSSNVTQCSNVTTMERINDLDFVETKLNSLKFQLETRL